MQVLHFPVEYPACFMSRAQLPCQLSRGPGLYTTNSRTSAVGHSHDKPITKRVVRILYLGLTWVLVSVLPVGRLWAPANRQNRFSARSSDSTDVSAPFYFSPVSRGSVQS